MYGSIFPVSVLVEGRSHLFQRQFAIDVTLENSHRFGGWLKTFQAAAGKGVLDILGPLFPGSIRRDDCHS
jgi:hypothetical protein